MAARSMLGHCRVPTRSSLRGHSARERRNSGERSRVGVNLFSRFLRALVLTTGMFSLFLWMYVAGRLIFAGVDVNYPFLDRVPGISIAVVGAGSFMLSFVCILTYLTLWWKLDR